MHLAKLCPPREDREGKVLELSGWEATEIDFALLDSAPENKNYIER